MTDSVITRKPYGAKAQSAPFPPCADMAGERLARLGIVTKTPSPPEQYFLDSSTGEMIPYEFGHGGLLKLVKTSQQARAERFALKSVVNRLLPESRTSKCMVFRAPVAGCGLAPIQVHKTTEHNKAFYTGLLSCGSVWNCPVCAAKVAERRRVELQGALLAASSLGWKVHFVTLTVPHGVGDDLAVIKSLQQKALERMNSGKNRIKNLFERDGIECHGFIRAYEITHGKENGFHPHFHILLFTSPNVSHDRVREIYGNSWSRHCVNVGLPRPSEKHGCTVQGGTKAAKYVTKWGIEDEMTKANTKVSKRKGKTPFGLLRAVLDKDDPEYSPEYAAGLFRVYSRCMSGARQLYWSNGLRAKLALAPEASDEQVAEKITDEVSVHLATITPEQWRSIRRAKAESKILDVAEHNQHLVMVVVDSYHQKYAKDFCGEGPAVREGSPKNLMRTTGTSGSSDTISTIAKDGLLT